ncbi:MAG: class I SAM-dependent methyltransferase [Sulfuricaulis sp.]
MRAQAVQVLEQIGAVAAQEGGYLFDYNPRDVIDEIVLSGTVPDARSHQYYPTPQSVACVAIAAAAIGPHDRCLEPSAGQGHLADAMPRDRTTCVELSAIHCSVLRAKGHTVHQGDFLTWAAQTEQRFERILMNPPFTAGQALAHVTAAADLLAPGGRLVAVMPASTRGKPVMKAWSHEWSEPMTGEFDKTGASVTVLTLLPPGHSGP